MKLPDPWWGEIATAVSLQDANANHFSLSNHFYPDFSCHLFYGMLCISSGPWSLWIELKTWIDRGQMCVCVFFCDASKGSGPSQAQESKQQKIITVNTSPSNGAFVFFRGPTWGHRVIFWSIPDIKWPGTFPSETLNEQTRGMKLSQNTKCKDKVQQCQQHSRTLSHH